MAGYSYIISLGIRHPSGKPADYTMALGLAPKRAWQAGEDRKTRSGRLLTGTNRETFWSANLVCGESTEAGLADALAFVIDKLDRWRSFFLELSSTDGRADLVIGWSFPEGHSGDVIGHGLLKGLSDLHLNLSFYIYPVRQESGSPPAWVMP